VRPASSADLAPALDALGITTAHRDALLLHARPEIALALALSSAEVAVGASTVGSAPDLRQEGTLSFFYDTVRQPPVVSPAGTARSRR